LRQGPRIRLAKSLQIVAAGRVAAVGGRSVEPQGLDVVALHTAALLVHFAESIAGDNVAVVRGELEKSCGLTIVLLHSAAVGMASPKHELGRIVTFGGRRPEEPHRFAVVTRYPLPEIVERPEIGSGPRVALIGRELVEARRFGQVLPHAQPFLV